VNNFSAEIADASRYPDIRLFTVGEQWSSRPQYDINDTGEDWTRPNRGLKMLDLGLYFDTPTISHKFCSMLSIINRLNIAKGIAKFRDN